MTKAIMIIGPTGTGKTKIAFELARRNRGAIVNLDRTYLYRKFPITTGMQDALNEHGVKRYLYELLDPCQASFTPVQFNELVANAVRVIQSTRDISIAEGGSTQYVPALLESNTVSRLFSHIIGIKLPNGTDPSSRYKDRIDQAFDDGLVDEIRNNLPAYQKSYLIKECHSAIPTIHYLKGELSLEEAKAEILKRLLDYQHHQYAIFSKHPNVQWIDVDTTQQAVDAIEEICFK